MSIAPYPGVGETVYVKEHGAGVVLNVDEQSSRISVVLESGSQIEVPVTDITEQTGPVAFASFECTECKYKINVFERLEPGQAAVEECPNCGVSWVLVLPPIEIYRTDKYPPIWPKIAQ